jgi:hypothetical protein
MRAAFPPRHASKAFRLLLVAATAAGCSGGDLALPSDPQPERLMLVDGQGQEGRPGQRLPTELVVRLVDGSGEGVPDRPVTWVVSAGGGQVQPRADSTDQEGYLRARWTLGPEIGVNTLDAVASNIGLVTFTATAVEGGAGDLTIEPIEGDGQRAPTGSSVPIRPAVRVTRAGAPVEGIEVSFEVTGGDGTVVGPTQLTNGEGIARVDDWILGPAPGENRLEATGEELSGGPVVFTAEGTSGSGVDRLVYLVEPPNAVEERERFRVEVALVDENGDVVPLSGVVIYLGLFRDGQDVPNNAPLLGDRFRETEDGVAVFDDLGVTVEGTFRLRALTDDLPEHQPHGPEPALFSDQFVVD